MKKRMSLLVMFVLLMAFALPVSAASKIYVNADVNLRKGPGLSYKIYTSVEEGTALKYLKKSKKDDRGIKWYKVSYKKKKLWVSSRYASKVSQPTTSAKKRVITTCRANLRKGPGTKYKIVADVSNGSSMKYLNQTKKDTRGVKWYKVSFYGKKVWISSKCCRYVNEDITMYVITTDSVNLRKGPSLGDSKYTSVRKGTIMKYLGKTIKDERDVKWYKVYYNGKSLWVSSLYSYIK